MNYIENAINWFTTFIEAYVVPTEFLMAALLGTGLFLTLRLVFVQIRRLKHGIEVTSGKFDDRFVAPGNTAI